MRTHLFVASLLTLGLLAGCGQSSQPDKLTDESAVDTARQSSTGPAASTSSPSRDVPTNLVGHPDVGMGLSQLLAAAKPDAGTPVVGHLELANTQRLPVRWVGVWTDKQVGNEQEFATSLGRVMRSLSATTGNEFCSQICKRDSEWGAAILTIDSGRYCPTLSLCPSLNWKHAGQQIHSHRRSGIYEMSAHDEMLRTGTARTERMVTLEAERASKEDFEVGGWLVGQDGLWHVGPKGELRAVWDYQREQAGPPARLEVQH